jgi:putative ABC transport system ATP-binding protein
VPRNRITGDAETVAGADVGGGGEAAGAGAQDDTPVAVMINRERNFSRAQPVALLVITRPILRAEGLTQTYTSGGRDLTVLRGVSFELEAGGFLAILGPSGSGKTTLLGLLAGLDRPREGRVVLDGDDLREMDEDARARMRAAKVGFVFQSFQLIPTLTARENVQVPLELRGEPEEARRRADSLLARVGLGDRGHHYPAQLSGGEQQRVALARAFSHRPRILFADEPTGNLDAATGAHVIDLLAELNRESGTTLVLVTHDADLARRAKRVLRLADGALVSDSAAA